MSDKKFNILLIAIGFLVAVIAVIIILKQPKAVDKEYVLVQDSENNGRLIVDKTDVLNLGGSIDYVGELPDGYIKPGDAFPEKVEVPEERDYSDIKPTLNIISDGGSQIVETLPDEIIGTVSEKIVPQEIEEENFRKPNYELYDILDTLIEKRNLRRIKLFDSVNFASVFFSGNNLCTLDKKGAIIVPFSEDNVDYVKQVLSEYAKYSDELNWIFLYSQFDTRPSMELIKEIFGDAYIKYPLYFDEFCILLNNANLPKDTGLFLVNCDSYIYKLYRMSDNLETLGIEIKGVVEECEAFTKEKEQVTEDFYVALYNELNNSDEEVVDENINKSENIENKPEKTGNKSENAENKPENTENTENTEKIESIERANSIQNQGKTIEKEEDNVNVKDSPQNTEEEEVEYEYNPYIGKEVPKRK